LIRRFGSALILNAHFQLVFPDRVYIDRHDGARFRWVKVPISHELTQLVQTIAQRVGRFLERQGLLERDVENGNLITDAASEGPMDQLLGHLIVYRVGVVLSRYSRVSKIWSKKINYRSGQQAALRFEVTNGKKRPIGDA